MSFELSAKMRIPGGAIDGFGQGKVGADGFASVGILFG